MQMVSDKPATNWRKVVISNVVGGVIGFAGMLSLVHLYEDGALGAIGPSGMIACVAGAVYLLIGLQVGVGLALPALGTRMLNVEDGEELRDQRRMLAYAAVAMAAWGGALIVLALAAPGGIVPPSAALAAALALFAGSTLLTLAMWRHMDELMKGMSRECGNLSFYLVALIGGGWAMLAHLGFGPAPAPLDWLTMFTALALVASFIAAARRGMLLPR